MSLSGIGGAPLFVSVSPVTHVCTLRHLKCTCDVGFTFPDAQNMTMYFNNMGFMTN